MFAPMVAKSKSKAAENVLGAEQRVKPDVAREPAPAETAARAAGWDFSSVPLFAPTSAPRPETLPGAPQRTLVIGDAHDPLEHEADRVAHQVMRARGPLPPITSAPPTTPAGDAPVLVDEVLRRPGRPLGAEMRAFFEPRFGRDFSGIRVHADGLAARSAQAVSARSYTVGDQIVFGAGAFAPERPEGRALIAHELAHTLQQSGRQAAWMQRQPVQAQARATSAAPAPRADYVFIMGEDKTDRHNPFYSQATRYFRAHVPGATLVQDQRSLDDLLGWIATNVTDPIGNLYIVSHGNEEGTLGFGLDSSDADARVTVVELREALHPSGGGSSKLHSVAGVVDAQTRIHIKGCNIGRTQEMVELIDEAFGGAGTVTAPTHEQDYRPDLILGAQARHRAHDQKIADFAAGLPAVPPAPSPVDRTLKGEDRKAAQKAHDEAAQARKDAQAARKAALAAEEVSIKPELDAIAAQAATVESLSGPMFQRPGTQRFTVTELQPDIDRLYGHLTETARKQLAARLVAPDRGGHDDQQGQRLDQIKPSARNFAEPATLAEARAVHAKDLKDRRHFTPKAFTSTSTDAGRVDVFTGTMHPPGGDPYDYTVTYDPEPIPTADSVIDAAKAQTNNPDRYAWRVERVHNPRTGMTTLTAIGERVMVYLHHGSLNAGPHDYFTRPESDPDFYATSIFAPPAP